MKTTRWIALGAVMLALPQVTAKSEVETSRERGARQDQKIRHLEDQTGGRAKSSGNSKAQVKSATQARPAGKQSKEDPSRGEASGRIYQIKQGDTFTSIAKSRHISVEKLIASNPDVKATELRPGQKIRLNPAATPIAAKSDKAAAPGPHSPGTAEAATSTTVPVATKSPGSHTVVATPAGKKPEPHPTEASAAVASKEAPAPSPSPKKVHSIKIDGPMTYGEFAAKHGTSTERLNDLNGLDLTHATVLAKGSELYIPAQP